MTVKQIDQWSDDAGYAPTKFNSMQLLWGLEGWTMSNENGILLYHRRKYVYTTMYMHFNQAYSIFVLLVLLIQ
jgi:hypothetical protein